MVKKSVFFMVVASFSCFFFCIAMDTRKRPREQVKQTWVPKAACALKLIEQSEKTNNWVRYNSESAAGSFNAKLDKATIYVFRDPEKKDERIEVTFSINEFKKLLEEPASTSEDDGPVEGHFVAHPEEETKCCSCCSFFCCCGNEES